jgi:hypothetical protein
VLINGRDCAVHAVSVPAIKKERVNSVEDGNTNERGAKKSHLSLPISGRKAIGTRQLSRIDFQNPSKSSIYSFQNYHGVGRNCIEQAQAGFVANKIARQALWYVHSSHQAHRKRQRELEQQTGIQATSTGGTESIMFRYSTIAYNSTGLVASDTGATICVTRSNAE